MIIEPVRDDVNSQTRTRQLRQTINLMPISARLTIRDKMNSNNFQELIMGQGMQFIAIALIVFIGITVYFALSRFLLHAAKQEAISESLFRVFKR